MMLVLYYKFNNEGAIELSNDPNFRNGLLFLIKNYKSDGRLLALLILSSVLFNPNNEKTVNDNNINNGLNVLTNILSNPNDKEFIRKDFLNYIIKFQLIEEFLEVQHGNNSLQSLPEFIIQNSFEVDKALELINADIVFTYFNDFYQAVDKDLLSSHIEDLYDREDDLVDRIIEKFETVPSKYQLHYFFAKACPVELRKPYFEFLVEGFKKLEKEEWLKHLTDETELVNLAILVQQSGFDLELSVKLKDALEEHYEQVYTGEIDPPSENLINDWGPLLDALDEDIKNAFLKNIKYYIESNANGMVSNIGYLYDSILISEGIYLTDTDRFISTVFTRVAKTDNEIELKWLKKLIENQPEILKQDESAANAFKVEVENLDLKKYSDKASKVVEEIAKILEVDIQNEPEDEG